MALRAMLHFDMLRLFGPVYMNNPENECIPYYLHQSPNVNDLLPANKIMEYVIHDLQEAEKALANDPIITKGTLMESAGNESNFLRLTGILPGSCLPGLMVSEFVVVWVELNWLRDVAGSVFFCEKGRPPGVCCLSPGLRRGLASSCRILLKASKIELASVAAQTAAFVKQRRFPAAKNQLPSCRVR